MSGRDFEVLYKKATKLYTDGKLGPALRALQTALSSAEKKDHPMAIAACHGGIGLVHYEQGQYDAAMEYTQRTIAACENEVPNSLTLAKSYHHAALIYRSMGHLDQALEFQQSAIAIQEQAAPNSLVVAASYHTLGLIYLERGENQKAIQQFQKALKLREREAPNSVEVAETSLQIGALCWSQNKLDTAEKYVDKSRSVLERNRRLSKAHPVVLLSKYYTGQVALQRGQADVALRNANEIIKALSDYKWAYLLKAKALAASEQPTEALEAYNAVLQVAPNFGDAHIARLSLRGDWVLAASGEERKTEGQAWNADYKVARPVNPAAADSVDERLQDKFRKEAGVGEFTLRQTPASKITAVVAYRQALQEQVAKVKGGATKARSASAKSAATAKAKGMRQSATKTRASSLAA